MTADPSIYQSDRLAESYASFRPPVHRAVCARMMDRLSPAGRLRSALDVGCGAGASTKALVPHVDRVVGVDPFPGMLRQAAMQVPSATFVQGRFESLPFDRSSFQVIATAGAINYADVRAALAEVARVLEPPGWFVAYDFSAARRLSVKSDLPVRHREFQATYAPAPGYALDRASLPYEDSGLRLTSRETFEVHIPMTVDDYLLHILGESGVEIAIASGTDEGDIKAYCEQLFRPVFEGGRQVAIFEAELLVVRRL